MHSGSSFFEEEMKSSEDSDIAKIYLAIADGAKRISRELSFRIGSTENFNPFGEKQAELDVYSNNLFCQKLLDTGSVGMIASEELQNPLVGSRPDSEKSLSVAMDPLDGSSNIVTNNPIGSIFGIWRGPIPQKGRDLVGSIFVTYGPTLSLTLTLDNKTVNQYIEARDGPNSGRFVLSYSSLRLPEKPEVYGFGGSRKEWIEPVEKFVSKIEERGLRLRYGGTFIGDYNQVMKRGGIFAYPALRGKPKGKFRLMYEASPVALINELMGGYSSNGEDSILETEPKKLSETTPFYTGNKILVQELETDIRGN